MKTIENLRSVMKVAFMLLACVMMGMSMVSCSDDDDKGSSVIPNNVVNIDGKNVNISQVVVGNECLDADKFDIYIYLTNGFRMNIELDGNHDGETVDLTKIDTNDGGDEDLWQWSIDARYNSDDDYVDIMDLWGGSDDFAPALSGSTLRVKQTGDKTFDIQFTIKTTDQTTEKPTTWKCNYSGEVKFISELIQ